MKRSAHRDIIREVQDQLSKGVENVKLDTTVGKLCDRSVGWIVDAIADIDNKELIMKAFEMCRVGNFNQSQASLTSPEALAAAMVARIIHDT
ncbi:hypothetical protein GALMADRAFT_139792 [Galerina marginata CBS 339.88]|uniref:Uncharacterized protein n=1 Tax=Galerina marginata (strain CBS 339.88) TaxID=685588 RepID=A0A067TAN2_GALM3|nr:hypothetical protein GALMADRAFT_139792 [Galerina marginata CBS 339.88]